MKAQALLILLVIILAAGCAPDPRNQADADKTRLLAEQQAADQTQARKQAADLHTQALRDAEQTQAVRVAAKNRMIGGASVIGLITLAALAAASVFVYVTRLAPGLAAAAVTAADLRARLIPLDKITRQYPLLQTQHNGQPMLTNPNAGQVLELTAGHDPNPQQIAATGQTQTVGLIADAAARMHNSEALPLPRVVYDAVITGNPAIKVLTPKGGKK